MSQLPSIPQTPSVPNPKGHFYIADPDAIKKQDIKLLFKENAALRVKIADLANLLTAAKGEIESLESRVLAAEDEDRFIVVNIPPSSVYKKENFHAYRFEMTDFQNYADNETRGAFSKFVVVTRREYEKEFVWKALSLYLADEANIKGQTAKAWFLKFGRISFDGEMVPVLLCMFTLADVQELMDIVVDATSKLNVDDVRNIHMRILERMVVDMQAKSEMSEDLIETAEAWAENWRKKQTELRKDISYNVLALDTRTQDAIDREKKVRLTPLKFGILLMGWVLFGIALLLLGLILGNVLQVDRPVENNPTNSTQTTALVRLVSETAFMTLWGR
jgi:hypothetical protein